MVFFGTTHDKVQTLGLVHSPAGPGPGHLRSGAVQTWVCLVQDRTLDSLAIMDLK